MTKRDEASVVERVDLLVKNGIVRCASDIHVESTPSGARVRYRIDGVLFDQDLIEKSIMLQVISRLKILANINIAQKRVPQDGKFTMMVDGNCIDLRVSTFPSINGEKVVVRILDRSKNMIKLESLGFSKEMFQSFHSLVHKSSGFFLVTGPTGSGKTTTLYAILNKLNQPQTKIITVEDPIEYELKGINQSQINASKDYLLNI